MWAIPAAAPDPGDIGDRLVQVHADPPHQQRGAVQRVEGVPQRRVRGGDRAAGDREDDFGRLRAARQPGLAGGGRHLGALLLGQRESHCAATPSLVPGPAARPGAGRLAVVTNLVIVKNVRHEPLSFLAASPARMRRKFPCPDAGRALSVCLRDRAWSKRKGTLRASFSSPS